MALVDFQALVRDGDHVVYDIVSGTLQWNDELNWWGSFQVPRNTDLERVPGAGQYYRLNLKDGRTGVMIVDHCLKQVRGLYPMVQFHGAGPLE